MALRSDVLQRCVDQQTHTPPLHVYLAKGCSKPDAGKFTRGSWGAWLGLVVVIWVLNINEALPKQS